MELQASTISNRLDLFLKRKSTKMRIDVQKNLFKSPLTFPTVFLPQATLTYSSGLLTKAGHNIEKL